MEDQLLQEKLRELPPAYKKAVASIDLVSKLNKIRDVEGLNLDQLGEVEVEITLSILGLRSVEDFVANIEEKLQIDDEKAISIANTVNEEIFLPIRNAMQQADTASSEPEPAPVVPTPAPVTPPPVATAPTPTTPKHLETPDEILKHIEDTPELPAPVIKVEVKAETPPIATPTLVDPAPAVPPTPITPPEPVHTPPPKKNYAVDPYREPLN